MKIKLLGIFLLIAIFAFGQKEEKETTHQLYKRLDTGKKSLLGENKHKIYPKISTAWSYGKNMAGSDFDEILDSKDYFSIDFRGGYQSIGKNIYDGLYRYPEWGVGYFGVKLYNDTLFGIPNAVFAYIDVPFNKWDPNRKWSFSYSIAGGLSYNFRPNNPETNPLNTLIGSYKNVYIDLGFYANYKLSKTIDAKMGLSFVHFSNGASTLPNMGMNLLGPKIILQHHVVRERPEVYVREEIPEWEKRHGIFIYQAFGSKQLEDHGTSYLNTTTSLAYKYWFMYKGQAVAQLDAFYDGSNNNRNEVPEADRDNPANLWSVGIFIGYEAIYNRWSFISGWGHYIWRNYEYSNPNYQRFGVRYRVYEGLVFGVGLKARTFAADYIEWSVAYNIF